MPPPSPSSSSSFLSNWRQWTIFHVFMFVTFLVSGVAVNAAQLVLFALLGTWNRRLFRRLNYYLVWVIYTQLLFLSDWWSRSRVVLQAEPDFLRLCGREHALIVMNHHYELDWLYGWMVADRFGVLGNGRVFLKRALRWAPVIGWCWSLSDVIYLDRDWEKDKENIAKGVRRRSIMHRWSLSPTAINLSAAIDAVQFLAVGLL